MSSINPYAEAEQMLTHYLSALSIYHKAVLLTAGLGDSLNYNAALELKERAFRMLARARGDYWDHVSRQDFVRPNSLLSSPREFRKVTTTE